MTDAAFPSSPALVADADRSTSARLRWWHDARFGLFLHWGLYSVLGRGEWAMELEAIPTREYERLADRFVPRPGVAAEWAAIARRAGMRYAILTAKHHDGFCLFDSALTTFSAPRQACGRDLVREYVEAMRREGLRVGLYYSLMDWHHPDGARAEQDEQARRRFVEYTHGQLRELLTNYGAIDILWYDSPWPLTAAGWESERMNRTALTLQPHLLVNDRNGLPGDFTTYEQRLPPSPAGAWETCMTTNESWGYHEADGWWKTPRDIVNYLVSCAHDAGNYLLNAGPRADGSIPTGASDALAAVGDWLARNGESIYASTPCAVRHSACATFTQNGRTLFVHVRHWPGDTLVIAGLQCRIRRVRLLATGEQVAFLQDGRRLTVTGLPARPPDTPVTTLIVDCLDTPRQDTVSIRRERRTASGDAASPWPA
jgi:alpha-L-fucosidase